MPLAEAASPVPQVPQRLQRSRAQPLPAPALRAPKWAPLEARPEASFRNGEKPVAKTWEMVISLGGNCFIIQGSCDFTR